MHRRTGQEMLQAAMCTWELRYAGTAGLGKYAAEQLA